MRIRVLLFILVLLGQFSVSVAEPSQVFVRIFDDALSESIVNGCPPIGVRAEIYPHPFKEPIHEALELGGAEFFLSHGIACAAPDSENNRKIFYWTLDAVILSESDEVPNIKQKLEELGADNGSRISFGSSSAKRVETLVNGEWLPTDQLGYEFSAEAIIAASDAEEIIVALNASHMNLEGEVSILQIMASIPNSHAVTFDSKLRRQSRDLPVAVAIQKTDSMTIAFTVLTRDKYLAKLVQAAFDSSL